METDIYTYTNKKIAKDSSSMLVPTDPNKKFRDKNDCDVGKFVLMLLNGNIYPICINLKSKEDYVVDCMEKNLKY